MIHPLQLFDQWRRAMIKWLPIQPQWERSAKAVAPEATEDWLLEPLNETEAMQLFPHLEREKAILQYQKLRLQLRCEGERGFEQTTKQ